MAVYLGDIITDIDETVQKYGNKLLVLAGVGAGKSTWVKEKLAKKGTVLFVTSRKAKVEADINDSCFSQFFDWQSEDNQLLITNAKLAAMVKRITADNRGDIDSFLKRFDYIVIDEVHSIATDSTFAPACSLVLDFIEYAVLKNKTVIAMTGTPEPIQYYFEQRDWKVLDYRRRCKYVHPERLILSTSYSVLPIILRYWQTRKIIYFANHVDTIVRLCKELAQTDGISADNIAAIVARSTEETLFAKLKKALPVLHNDIKKTTDATYKSIIEDHVLPEECGILFSTSALKEGIDIWNDNMIMLCESHDLSNLIQFFGRARGENCRVYVIEDVSGFDKRPEEIVYSYNVEREVYTANEFLRDKFNGDDESCEIGNEKEEFISYIERKDTYLRFNYFMNEFEVFDVKFNEETRVAKIGDWKKKLQRHARSYDIPFAGFMDLQGEMQEALICAVEKRIRFYKEQNEVVQRMVKWAYNIAGKQPKKLNEELEGRDAPVRIIHGTETKEPHRNKAYWQVVSVEEHKEKP